jgi:hypothetical protein
LGLVQLMICWKITIILIFTSGPSTAFVASFSKYHPRFSM